MSKNKEVVGIIKLQVPSGKANPAPPIGPALGQRGLNIMDFCKEFNAMKFDFPVGTPIPVTITAYKDRSFTFITKLPPVSYMIKQALSLEKGCSEAGKISFKKVKRSDLAEIAEKKMKDMNATDLDSCLNMVVGSAISMGIEVID